MQPEDDGLANCPISKCDTGGNGTCGVNARCTRGYCVCDLGMRGNGTAGMWRGSEGLESVTVFSDLGIDCDTQCDDLSCKEVEQLESGVCWKSAGGDNEESDGSEETGDNEDEDSLVTYENMGSGGAAN
jgi:hypothetical protein